MSEVPAHILRADEVSEWKIQKHILEEFSDGEDVVGGAPR